MRLVRYKEMCHLRDLGANNPTGVAYTDEEILAMVIKGKQRGKVAGRGRMLSRKTILPETPSGSYARLEIDEMMADKDKKIEEAEKKADEAVKESKAVQHQLTQILSVLRSNPQWAELMSEIPSRYEVGSGSGAGGSGGGGSGAGGGGSGDFDGGSLDDAHDE